MESFSIADKYSKEHADNGISVFSLYTNNSLKMMSELQKTTPRGNTKFERLADERFLMRGTFFDRPTRDIPSLEEFKTKPLFCPLPGLGRSQKRICLSNRSFGTTDETAAAPICLKEPGLWDDLFAVDAGIAHSETTGKLPDPISCYRSNLSLESMGTTAIESRPLSEVPTPRNEITDKAAQASGECLTESIKLPNKLSETEREHDGDGTLIDVNTLKQSHKDQKELQVSADILQRVGAWFLKHAATSESGFVQLNINGYVISNEGVDELKKIMKDGTNLLAMLGLVDENEQEEAKVNDREEVDAGGDMVKQMGN